MTTNIDTATLSENPEVAIPGMFDLVLKNQEELDTLMLDDSRIATVIERLLALSVIGLVLTGLSVGIAAEVLDLPRYSMMHTFFGGQPVIWMPLTMVAAFLGALSICLPSFYFYTQLSGIDASFRLVTAQALRAQATTSVLLLAALPVFLIVALSNVVTGVVNGPLVLGFGLALPFIVGLLGIGAVYRSFGRLVQHCSLTHRRCGNYVRRLIVCWGAVYTFVAPVALIRIGNALSGVF